MDPRYMDNCEFDTLSIVPYKKKQKKSCEINEALGLLRSVSLLGVEKS